MVSKHWKPTVGGGSTPLARLRSPILRRSERPILSHLAMRTRFPAASLRGEPALQAGSGHGVWTTFDTWASQSLVELIALTRWHEPATQWPSRPALDRPEPATNQLASRSAGGTQRTAGGRRSGSVLKTRIQMRVGLQLDACSTTEWCLPSELQQPRPSSSR
jgi:hypothetical protein